MVSQDSPQNPASSMVHQFIVSDNIASNSQFENQNFNAYDSNLRGNNTFHQSLGVLPSIQVLGERMSRSIDLVRAPLAPETEISHTRHLMDLLGSASETNQRAQRLSLSLGSQLLFNRTEYRQRTSDLDLVNPGYMISGEGSKEGIDQGLEQVHGGDYSSLAGNTFPSPTNPLRRLSPTCSGTEFTFVLQNSKYLKPAQLLLEELVSVNSKEVEISHEKFVGKLFCGGRREALRLSAELKAEWSSSGILPTEKQELQVKIAKMVELLDEVEIRYEKYYHQLEQAVSSFEEEAGLGTARSYTGLALQAMSRHFCNLRDSIVSQINVLRRKFSQDLPKISTGLSQLSLFDREMRQNRIPLQQLGLIQSQRQAWRPIRGLPETSVAILRSWLFEHFLHPYPNDSEKLMLASQTGLSKNQVSNWFINARVRLWKPMIEEMYKEEFTENLENSNQEQGDASSTHHPED